MLSGVNVARATGPARTGRIGPAVIHSAVAGGNIWTVTDPSADAATSPAAEREPFVAVLATDGSEPALEALAQGLAVVRPDARLIVVTVAPDTDPSLATGTGFAGGVMSGEEIEELFDAQLGTAQQALHEATTRLGTPDAERIVLRGEPGAELCELARARSADVIVLGTRGHGGLRRAVLGSVSDHVVRHAPCPVLTIGETTSG